MKAWSLAASMLWMSAKSDFTLLLGLAQSVGERWGGATARDELDEVVDAGLGAVQLDLLEAQLLRDVGEQILHLRGGSFVDLISGKGCRTSCASAVLDRVPTHLRQRRRAPSIAEGGALRGSGRSAAPASSGGSLRDRAARERRRGVLQRGARRSSGIPVLRPFTDSWRA